ncbi:MAG: Protease 3 precursor [Planctomycetota bacterium]
MPKKITSIEGISEYRLDNGVQVLLFPDASKSTVTVNMTVLVGSRHEGYGEAGMAHLLEHMLFKGTPTHTNIPKELQDRGARFNGTTWLDRTNYYETIPAKDDNLEFALRLESDRLMNSTIKAEDLASEFSVVRSEFERGENSPQRVLMQRVQSAAFEWHNYGKSTIGNRSDIERVPIPNLRNFYRKYYRPDNVMLVVAGKFKTEDALALIQKYFGALVAPEAPLERTYTVEPPQDGERLVVLRRVGDSQLLSAAYHIPSGGHPDYPAIEVLSNVFGTEPSGRLYKNLVQSKLASNVSAFSFSLHDPGMIMFGAELPKDASMEEAQKVFLDTIENVAKSPIQADEVNRAKVQLLKDRELRATNTTDIAIELSDWGAQGDWRLYFLFRDRIEELKVEDVQRVAETYLVRNNRTLGQFIPSEKSERATIPERPVLSDVLADYKGRGDLEQGEEFDSSPLAIEERTERGVLVDGIKYAMLAKKTRGNTVNMTLNLRYGDENSLKGLVTASEILPDLLLRGTESLDYQALQDKLDELRTQIRASGTTGLLTISLQTKRQYLEELIPLIGEILRKPRMDAEEFEVLRRQYVTAAESQLSEPQALAPTALTRILNKYDKDDVRYNPTIEEEIERYKTVSVDDVRKLQSKYLSSQAGEVVLVGDFDVAAVKEQLTKALWKWKSEIPYQRIANKVDISVPGEIVTLQTPDKANAVYYAGEQFAMTDSDPLYPAMVVGNFVFGSGALASRLGDRVRQKEGLSYGVNSGLNAHPIDKRATLTLVAIANPANRDKLISVIAEEFDLLLEKGITEEELARAKQGILQGNAVGRTNDGAVAGQLASTIFADRTMEFQANLEKAITELTVEQVNEALKKLWDRKRMVIVTAGDFPTKE